MTIYLASGNEHKKKEIAEILTGHKIVLPAEKDIFFEFDETGKTFMENALGKARHLHNLVRQRVIADDSGLCVPSLNGEPGIYSARYGSDHSPHVLSDKDRNDYLLEKMKDVTDRSAFFVCCMIFLVTEHRFFAVQETFHGEITLSSQGQEGFGYDPLFFLPDYGKTVAQLEPAEKNRISHRGKAAVSLVRLIDSI
ncbi:MAG: RdgB/HAM1 family non-canonical purine NTP pyrophosphatase [Spirochaetales bacterium]|jgi:XTP/dITP diphosphohydrolase|nr:RdgB/HAM1 family non-canonical purine NTP pyrophosphatase [Spirochaetales bacterium]